MLLVFRSPRSGMLLSINSHAGETPVTPPEESSFSNLSQKNPAFHPHVSASICGSFFF
jgi:hypothetical protein